MKSQKLIASLLSLSFLIPGSIIAFQNPVYAFCVDLWNDDCDLIPDEVIPEIDDVVDSQTIRLINNSDSAIYFYVGYDDQPGTLAPGAWVEYSSTGAMEVDFDSSFRSGYQEQAYDLTSGVYHFESDGYGIDLYSE